MIAAPAGRIVVVGGEEAAGTIAEVETYDAAERLVLSAASRASTSFGLSR